MTHLLVAALLLSATGQRAGIPAGGGDASGRTVLSSGSTTARSLAARFADTVNVKDYLPAGQPDGTTDNAAGIQTAADAAAAAGKALEFPEGVFAMTYGPLITKGLHIRGSGRGTVLKLIAPLAAAPANQHLRVKSDLGSVVGTASGALTAGQRTLTLSAVTGLAEGDTVFLRLGPDPYDANEEQIRMFNVVESVVGDVVTFRVGWPEDIADGTHYVYEPTSIVDGLVIENLSLDFADGLVPDRQIQVFAARNVTIRNVWGPKFSTGISIEESENVLVDGVYVARADRSLHSGAGRLFGIWGSRNVAVRNVYGFDVDRGVFLESQNRGVLLDNVSILSGSTASAADPAMNVRGGSKDVVLRGFTFGSDVARAAVYVTQAAEVRQEGTTLLRGAKSSAVSELASPLTYKGVRYDRRQKFSKPFRLTASMSGVDVGLPSGIYARARVYVSTTTGITGFHVQNSSSGSGGSFSGSLVAGQTVELGAPYIGLGTDYPVNEIVGKKTSITTDGTVPAGAWGVLEIEYLSATGDDAGRGFVEDTTHYVRAGVLELNNAATFTTGTAAPSSGTWKPGDRVFNVAGSGGAPDGWVCTVGGSPGTWKPMGARMPAGAVAATYSASMTLDTSTGTFFTVTPTDGSAFTLTTSNPTTGEVITVRIKNTFGVLGAATFGSPFRIGAAWTQPANGYSRSISFAWDGSNYVEIGRTAADVSN